MRFRGVLVATLLLVMLTAAGAPISASTEYPDVSGELREVTDVLRELGIMRGWGGRFWPGESFVREQLAAVVVRLVGLADEAAANTGRAAEMYIDAPDPGHWSTPYLITAFENYLLRGDSTDQGRVCSPAGTVTFDHTITVVLRALGHETDAMRGNWPEAYRDKALDLGLITPAIYSIAGDDATRGQIASLVGAAVLDVPKADGTFLFPEWARDDGDTDPEPPLALPPAPSITISILGREQPVEFPAFYAGRPLLLSFFSPG